MTRSTIGGTLTPDALAALSGRDRFRPLDRETIRAAVSELAARGLKARDIAQSLSLSESSVRQLLEERST
jgi:DNA-binding NarL/FixJ family response regulator